MLLRYDWFTLHIVNYLKKKSHLFAYYYHTIFKDYDGANVAHKSRKSGKLLFPIVGNEEIRRLVTGNSKILVQNFVIIGRFFHK
jgi:hypothetical protein